MPKSLNFSKNWLSICAGRDSRQGAENLKDIARREKKLFDYQTLAAATQNFDPKFKLGQGGFGPVFKGKLKDGREIAVKKLSKTSNQGLREFASEATLLVHVQHRNVVSLLGYSAFEDERLLVYEYIANESLDKILFDVEKRRKLDWKRRYDIIVGIARGLLYLHEDSYSCIVHRDIKASNVLLDNKWTAKIADFGMARLFSEDETHVNTRVAGTSGYMAPEYVMHGQLSVKADVYSYGVVLLELISGRKNSSFLAESDVHSLPEWAWKLFKEGRRLDIADPSVASTASADQVAVCLQVGLLCTQADPKLRPSMQRVLTLLYKKPGKFEEPRKPICFGSPYSSANMLKGKPVSSEWSSHSGSSSHLSSTSGSALASSSSNT